jgi:hypothetical protein
MVEFLIDHPMAQGVVRGMMKNAATTGDDPKQVAKLCKECRGFDGDHTKDCSKPQPDRKTCSKRAVR